MSNIRCIIRVTGDMGNKTHTEDVRFLNRRTITGSERNLGREAVGKTFQLSVFPQDSSACLFVLISFGKYDTDVIYRAT